MKAREPDIQVIGPGAAIHDQRCAVLPNASAVLDMDEWVFKPSWQAQTRGWHLVKARTQFQRLVLRLAFGIRPSAAIRQATEGAQA